MKCLEPIRQNTRLAEAPANRKTIFEYAPDSHGAEDYQRVVDWLVGAQPGAEVPVPLGTDEEQLGPQPATAGA